MCAILDINCLSDFLDETNTDMKPLRDWFYELNGKFAYSPTEKFQKEWSGINRRTLLREWLESGKLKNFDKLEVEEIEREVMKLENGIKSNDSHIIALAIHANIKVLISRDENLGQDFANRNIMKKKGRIYKKGKIYKNGKKHGHLLKEDLCP